MDEELYGFVSMRDEENVTRLLGLGANPNYVTDKGWSVLYWASFIGWDKGVNILLKAGAEVDKYRYQGKTELLTACSQIRENAAITLFMAGANINAKDSNGSTVLHGACGYGSPEFVALLASFGADIEAKDNWGRAPMHIAIEHGNLDVVEKLIELGASLESADRNGRTPLSYRPADSKNHREILSILLDNGADPAALDDSGQTAAKIAGYDIIIPLIYSKPRLKDKFVALILTDPLVASYVPTPVVKARPEPGVVKTRKIDSMRRPGPREMGI